MNRREETVRADRSLWPHLAVLAVLCFCTGFTAPSPDALKEKLAGKLHELREKTPGAKALAAWHKAWDEALRALETAREEGALRYAPDLYKEASAHLDKAKHYASERSYDKAEYLARRSEETARMSVDKAATVRKEKRNEAKSALDEIRRRIEPLEKGRESLSPERRIELDEVILAWRDLVHAVELEEFEVLEERIPLIERRIDGLAKGEKKEP